MKSLVAVLLMIVTLLVPLSAVAAPLAPATFTAVEFAAMAETLGCDADVEVFAGSLNGVFAWDPYYGGRPYVAVWTDGTQSWDAVALVAIHEIGHCIQYQNGELFDYPWKEFDADSFAIENAERFGVKPDADLDSLISFTNGRDPHAGWDRPHGSPAGRQLFSNWQLNRLVPWFNAQGA
jgi:hypothetical protein